MTRQEPCRNTHDCPCPSTDCKNHGRCCDCIANHRFGKNPPACLRETFAAKD